MKRKKNLMLIFSLFFFLSKFLWIYLAGQGGYVAERSLYVIDAENFTLSNWARAFWKFYLFIEWTIFKNNAPVSQKSICMPSNLHVVDIWRKTDFD